MKIASQASYPLILKLSNDEPILLASSIAQTGLRNCALSAQSAPTTEGSAEGDYPLCGCEFYTSSVFSAPPCRMLSVRISPVIPSPCVRIEESGREGRAHSTPAPTTAVPGEFVHKLSAGSLRQSLKLLFRNLPGRDGGRHQAGFRGPPPQPLQSPSLIPVEIETWPPRGSAEGRSPAAGPPVADEGVPQNIVYKTFLGRSGRVPTTCDLQPFHHVTPTGSPTRFS